VSRADLVLLARYEQRNGATQCRYGCGACLSSCPEAVPIDAVLRTRMYAEDYGAPELARAEYAALGRGAEACIGCAHRACAARVRTGSTSPRSPRARTDPRDERRRGPDPHRRVAGRRPLSRQSRHDRDAARRRARRGAGIRAVLGLFEGVCTGAADGYARMTGKPALTLLHLGPGFANGIANLHNARRAHSPS
jgi:ferredoxin